MCNKRHRPFLFSLLRFICVHSHDCASSQMLTLFRYLLQPYETKSDPFAVLKVSLTTFHFCDCNNAALRNSLERERNSQVLKGLLYSSTLQLPEQRTQLESTSVLIYDYSVCPVCKKNFTNQSALVPYPDGNNRNNEN